MEDINTKTLAMNVQFQARFVDVGSVIEHSDNQGINSSLESDKSGVQVNISKQGHQAQEKYAQDKAKLGQKISNQLRANNNKDDQVEEKSSDPFELAIALIKEQIREVKLQLEKLENDDSEVADKQREILNAQLIELNGQLLSTYEKKMRAEGENF
jgi:hypothetical protein